MKTLRNLGPKSAAMLQRAGINNLGMLRTMGAAMAYVHVCNCQGKPSLNLLYAIAAGLSNRDWRDLSRPEKAALRMEIQDLRELLETQIQESLPNKNASGLAKSL